MHRIKQFVNGYFFSSSPYHAMGFLRIALVFSCLPLQIPYSILSTPALGFPSPLLAELHRPGLFIDLLSLPFPLPPGSIRIYAQVYFCAGICSLFGFCCRPALFVFGLSTIYFGDIVAAKGLFNHEISLTSQVLLLLAFAPGSSALSLDRLFRWVFSARKTGLRWWEFIVFPKVPVWGQRTILILLACTYFTAGLSKVRYGGYNWLDGETLTYYLDGSARSAPTTATAKPLFIGPPNVPVELKWKDGFGIYSYSYGNRQASPHLQRAGEIMAANRPLMMALSVLIVVFELLAIVILSNGWLRCLYLLLAIFMHATIGLLMGLPFQGYQIICFFLLDWKWLFSWLRPVTAKVIKSKFG